MKELELYVHLPFCVKKCNYCDFLSGPDYDRESYLFALEREMESYRARCSGYEITTLFFGGGTPTLLSAGQWDRLAGMIRKNFRLAEGAEITAEGNPGTVDREKLRAMKRAGVNRFSIGLQSAREEELRLLGRIHTYRDFLLTYEMAREEGFDNINIDLIGALPFQRTEQYMETIRKAAALRPEHLSVYSLILEPGTPFYETYQNGADLPGEEEERQMYWMADRYLQEQGYRRYEISNYSLPGKECRHNTGYWTGKEYLGLGLGAASLFGGERCSNTREMKEYLSAEEKKDIRREREPETPERAMEERMFLGLRMTRGISEEDFFRDFGVTVEQIYGPVLKRLEELELLCRRGGRIFLTERGTDVSSAVMAEFLL